MEPILISFSICVIGVIGAVTLFSVAMRDRGEPSLPEHPDSGMTSETPFFLEEGDDARLRAAFSPESILAQLERHFRLEEAAARSYLDGPSSEALHAPSPSPLWD
jgi:hypothetical protein